MIAIIFIFGGFIGLLILIAKLGALPFRFIFWLMPGVIPMMLLIPKSLEQPTEKIAEYILLAIGFTLKFIFFEIPKFLLGL